MPARGGQRGDEGGITRGSVGGGFACTTGAVRGGGGGGLVAITPADGGHPSRPAQSFGSSATVGGGGLASGATGGDGGDGSRGAAPLGGGVLCAQAARVTTKAARSDRMGSAYASRSAATSAQRAASAAAGDGCAEFACRAGDGRRRVLRDRIRQRADDPHAPHAESSPAPSTPARSATSGRLRPPRRHSSSGERLTTPAAKQSP